MNNIFNRIIADISTNEPIKTFIVGNNQNILITELKKINKKFAITTLSPYQELDMNTTNSLSNEKFDFFIIDGLLINLFETLSNCKKLCSRNNIVTIINFNIKDYINIWERATLELNLNKLMIINIEEDKSVIWGNFILD